MRKHLASRVADCGATDDRDLGNDVPSPHDEISSLAQASLPTLHTPRLDNSP